LPLKSITDFTIVILSDVKCGSRGPTDSDPLLPSIARTIGDKDNYYRLVRY
jgi:hypothetical protein